MLSALITTPSRRSASAAASADLPLAVGPAISTAGCRARSCICGMNNVLTLIGNPADGLPPDAPPQARDALASAGATLEATDWLAPDLACDIGFDGPSPEQARNAVASR